MENRLKKLIDANSEANRTRWAKEWQKQGEKAIGVMSAYVPEEVISAASMLPWRITGTWQGDTSHARVYRSDSSCSYCNHVMESFLNGELDFLDGIVATDLDQDLLRTWDVLVYLKKKPFAECMHIPFVDSKLNYQFLAGEVKRLADKLEALGGKKITDEALWKSIKTYNKMRELIGKVYELRKREVPPLSGAEVLGITLAAQVMPKEEFNKELEALLPFIEKRKTSLKHVHPRLLITSEMLDNPAYIDLIEEGCLVAMDDMDTGSRYFLQPVDTKLKNPAYALAKRYLHRPSAPRMSNWDKQVEQITDWVKEYKIDGVIGMPHAWCYQHQYRMPFLTRKLEAAGIPSVRLDREYHLTNAGQLRTRIGAFLEMIGSK